MPLDMKDYTRSARIFWAVGTVVGGSLLITCLGKLTALDSPTLIQIAGMAAIAAIVGFFPVPIPGTKAALAGGEIFIFLTLLLYGIPAAVTVAAIESFIASVRSSKRWTSRIGSPAFTSISMLMCASAFEITRRHIGVSGLGNGALLGALILFGLAYFAISSFFASALIALKKRAPITPWKWWTSMGWIAFAYMADASIAGLLLFTFEHLGMSVLLVGLPVIAMFLSSLHSYAMRKEADERADALLRNMLPEKIAEELKASGRVAPRRHEDVTVLFSDFRGFTNIASTVPAATLVSELNEIFSGFDQIMVRQGVEKIKTIGDAYMAVSGLPDPREDHAIRCARVALEMVEWLQRRNQTSPIKWPIRIGLHSGPVIAGVVGATKYAYDLWGDTVNTAARLEATSLPGRINISAYTRGLLADAFACEYRGKIEAKGKGEIDMYFLEAAGAVTPGVLIGELTPTT